MPPNNNIPKETLNRIEGSIVGMAIGDALGAHVEFRPRSYLEQYPVKDFQGGGTWNLKPGQVTMFVYCSILGFVRIEHLT